MDKTEADIRRGEEAAFLLSHPLYKAAFADIEHSLIELWADANMHDAQSQQEYLRSLKNLRRLRAVLEEHVTTGKVAADKLEREKKMLDRLRLRLSV